MSTAESLITSAAGPMPGTWQTPATQRLPVAHGWVSAHGAPSGSATCVQPVVGSQTSAVQGLPSSHWIALVQASISVVLVGLAVEGDVEDVVAELEEDLLVEVEVEVLVVEWVVDVDDVVAIVELEEEVLVVVGAGVVVDVAARAVVEVVDEVEVLVLGRVVEVEDEVLVVVGRTVVEVVDEVEVVVLGVGGVVDVEDVVAVVEVDEDVLVVRDVDVELEVLVLVVERVLDVEDVVEVEEEVRVVLLDDVVVVVGSAGSVSSFERALSVPSLSYAVAVNACPTEPSSPPTARLMVPSAAGVGIPASSGAP